MLLMMRSWQVERKPNSSWLVYYTELTIILIVLTLNKWLTGEVASLIHQQWVSQ